MLMFFSNIQNLTFAAVIEYNSSSRVFVIQNEPDVEDSFIEHHFFYNVFMTMNRSLDSYCDHLSDYSDFIKNKKSSEIFKKLLRTFINEIDKKVERVEWTNFKNSIFKGKSKKYTTMLDKFNEIFLKNAVNRMETFDKILQRNLYAWFANALSQSLIFDDKQIINECLQTLQNEKVLIKIQKDAELQTENNVNFIVSIESQKAECQKYSKNSIVIKSFEDLNIHVSKEDITNNIITIASNLSVTLITEITFDLMKYSAIQSGNFALSCFHLIQSINIITYKYIKKVFQNIDSDKFEFQKTNYNQSDLILYCNYSDSEIGFLNHIIKTLQLSTKCTETNKYFYGKISLHLENAIAFVALLTLFSISQVFYPRCMNPNNPLKEILELDLDGFCYFMLKTNFKTYIEGNLAINCSSLIFDMNKQKQKKIIGFYTTLQSNMIIINFRPIVF